MQHLQRRKSILLRLYYAYGQYAFCKYKKVYFVYIVASEKFIFCEKQDYLKYPADVLLACGKSYL